MTTVEKIHNEVDTVQDNLLAEALKTMTENQIDFSKADRLKELGFKATEFVEGATKKKELLVQSTEQAELIIYYKDKYPFLKFLTEGELDRICKKYNLIYAPVERYRKDVPDKNLKELEDAQALDPGYQSSKEDDRPDNKFILTKVEFLSGVSKEDKQKIRKHVYSEAYESDGGLPREALGRGSWNVVETRSMAWEEIDVNCLYIAAPKSHFHLEDLKNKKRGFFKTSIVPKPVPDDPIVFRYVRGGVQVLTKWGTEAEDPALVVPLNN